MIYIFSRIGGPAQLAKLNPVVNARIYSQQSGFGNNSAPIKVVSKAALIDLLKKPTFVLVDVRKRYEVERGMIPTAVNIPLDQLRSALELDNVKFKIEYGIPKPCKDQKIIFYCQAGLRSHSACELASAIGYTDVTNYEGSWSEWSSS